MDGEVKSKKHFIEDKEKFSCELRLRSPQRYHVETKQEQETGTMIGQPGLRVFFPTGF